jgi:Fic family protein
MTPDDFTTNKWGKLLRQPEGFWAFIPSPLPPQLNPDWSLVNQVTTAERELAHLAGLARNLPNPQLLIGPFLRREAVLSSRIEGTQASLSDLFLFEAAEHSQPNSDVTEVANYVRALEYGLHRLATLPISLRLMNELHQRLMHGVRGGHLTPGEFRRSQNWVGPAGCTLNEATYVPPPVVDMKEALGQLETFIHAPQNLPPLVRLALIHYQFEAIHPYLDGNGRIGRLLITLILCAEKLLIQPLLYLSAFFEKNRSAYYQLLFNISQRGEWIPWIEFFLRGVAEQSTDAIHRTEKLLALKERYAKKLQATRASALPLRLLDELFQHPILSVSKASRLLKITPKAAGLNIDKLVKHNILTEVTGQKRHRLFAAQKIIDLAEAGHLQDETIS